MKSKIILILTLFISMRAFSQIPILWGIATFYGASGEGSLYKINADGTGFVQWNLPSNIRGTVFAGTVTQAPNGIFYGMTNGGGSSGIGDIFSFNPTNNTFNNVLNFNGSNGGGPRGTMLLANNSLLYGVTTGGASGGSGCPSPSCGGTLFSLDPSTNIYTPLYFFGCNGCFPWYGLIQANNNLLYGLTTNGGINSCSSTGGNCGTIYSFDINTNTYSKLYDFDGTRGSNPYGNLLQASSGLLYGVTTNGGAYSNGVLFSFNISNNTYTKLSDFNFGTYGNGQGTLVEVNNILYGLIGSTTYPNGLIYSYNILTDSFDIVHVFTSSNSSAPLGSLIKASNGILYGTASAGGSDCINYTSCGTVFSLDPSTNNYLDLYHFDILDSGARVPVNLTEYNPTYNSIKVFDNKTLIAIYPNPNNGSFVIEPSNATKQTMQVYDVNGKLVLSQPITGKTSIDAVSLNEGVYNICLTSNEGVVNKRLVIVR